MRHALLYVYVRVWRPEPVRPLPLCLSDAWQPTSLSGSCLFGLFLARLRLPPKMDVTVPGRPPCRS